MRKLTVKELYVSLEQEVRPYVVVPTYSPLSRTWSFVSRLLLTVPIVDRRS